MLGMWDNTPLICACQYSHAEVALALIQAGADVHAVNEKGNTSLLHACVEGLTEVVSELLHRGADATAAAAVIYNSVTDSNQVLSPLMAACVNNHVDCVKLLVAHGARVNDEISRETCHVTAVSAIGSDLPSRPLDVAVAREYSELVDFLVSQGASRAGGPAQA
jgi:ankyrin repeat protein